MGLVFLEYVLLSQGPPQYTEKPRGKKTQSAVVRRIVMDNDFCLKEEYIYIHIYI